ncbi:hypothetical protein EOA28_19490 [Mesorhizobium sp. M2A.F.Ca.ET.067.02.1.1]|nr:hypothetical protein EOA28_19490 [Mesorhizobium sp. M2A.F.Ca.ET.067.02.1.1]TIU58560.1 MAG: hypothetical protein E5W35_03855 [Mesorhizobium sp.]
MAIRFEGVDVGGTFTDLIFYDDTIGEVWAAKFRIVSWLASRRPTWLSHAGGYGD